MRCFIMSRPPTIVTIPVVVWMLPCIWWKNTGYLGLLSVLSWKPLWGNAIFKRLRGPLPMLFWGISQVKTGLIALEVASKLLHHSAYPILIMSWPSSHPWASILFILDPDGNCWSWGPREKSLFPSDDIVSLGYLCYYCCSSSESQDAIFLYLFIELTVLSVSCVDKVDKTQLCLQRSLQTRDKNT